jgi:hypothetical protein
MTKSDKDNLRMLQTNYVDHPLIISGEDDVQRFFLY